MERGGITMIDPTPLRNAIDGATTPVYPSSKAELVAAYQEKFTGRGAAGWKQHLVKDLSELTGIKPKNLEKRFDPQRLGNAEKRNAGQYADLGKKLDPIRRDVPAKGLTVTVDFTAQEDKGHAKRERTATVHMSSMEAYQFVNNPSYADFFDLWADGLGEYYGEDGDYEIEVTSVSAA